MTALSSLGQNNHMTPNRITQSWIDGAMTNFGILDLVDGTIITLQMKN